MRPCRSSCWERWVAWRPAGSWECSWGRRSWRSAIRSSRAGSRPLRIRVRPQRMIRWERRLRSSGAAPPRCGSGGEETSQDPGSQHPHPEQRQRRRLGNRGRRAADVAEVRQGDGDSTAGRRLGAPSDHVERREVGLRDRVLDARVEERALDVRRGRTGGPVVAIAASRADKVGEVRPAAVDGEVRGAAREARRAAGAPEEIEGGGVAVTQAREVAEHVVDLVLSEPDEVERASGDTVAPIVVVGGGGAEADVAVEGGTPARDEPERLGLRAREHKRVAGRGWADRQILDGRLVVARGRIVREPVLHLRVAEVAVQRVETAAERGGAEDVTADTAEAHAKVDGDVVGEDIAPGGGRLPESVLDLGGVRARGDAAVVDNVELQGQSGSGRGEREDGQGKKSDRQVE